MEKIEGRFQAIDYIEDSKEVYRLLSEIVAQEPIRSSNTNKDQRGCKKIKNLGRKDFTYNL